MNTIEEVKHYYGTILQSSKDLKTDACCTSDAMPSYLKALLENIHPEVQSRYYGCGLVIPEALEDCHILDLGCGSGRDVFLLAAMVGERGSVTGVDMTEEQLEIAIRHQDYHRERLGYSRPNTGFVNGQLEHLLDLDLPRGCFDIVISNCVLNLVPDKSAVLKQVFELLKPGGEFYFSDVYADWRVADDLRSDPVLYGECLGGALYWNDFLRLAKTAGFSDPRLASDRPLNIDDPRQQEKLGNIQFYSATYRLIKIQGLDSSCEDYGQAVRYKGSIPHHKQQLLLDKHHIIETGRIFPVCGNTYRMLKESRFAPHFDFFGDTNTHFGIFKGCGTDLPFDNAATSPESGGCC